MKKYFFYLMLLIPFVTTGQELSEYQLARYNNAETPIAKGNILLLNYQQYKGTPSETLKMLLKQLAYFTQEKDNAGMAFTQLNIGYLVAKTGDLSISLKYGMTALKQFETFKDTASWLSSYILIGNSLTGSENLEEGLKYWRKSYPIAKKFHKDRYYYSTILNNTADCFIKMNMPDSALPYIQEAVRMDYKNNDVNSLPSSISTLGETYLARKEYDIGRPFMRKSIYFSKKIKDTETLAYALGVLSQSFYETAETDSSVAYAYRSLHYSIPDYKLITLKSYELLYKNFVRKKEQDSAYKYLRLEIGIKDLLFSDEKLRNIQTLNFHEQMRQEELTVERQKADQQRKQNIQYGFIAIGLITIIILFLILSHSVIANARMIKFFSITGLLLLFEFLNMVFHPFLDRITFHSPVLMLIALVCLAFLLIPAHHKLEKWATEQLLRKNKKIRLAAAKKTLSALGEPEIPINSKNHE